MRHNWIHFVQPFNSNKKIINVFVRQEREILLNEEVILRREALVWTLATATMKQGIALKRGTKTLKQEYQTEISFFSVGSRVLDNFVCLISLTRPMQTEAVTGETYQRCSAVGLKPKQCNCKVNFLTISNK